MGRFCYIQITASMVSMKSSEKKKSLAASMIDIFAVAQISMVGLPPTPVPQVLIFKILVTSS